MNYIILDLEWNGAYSKKTHGFFNEIIEIGATKLDEQRNRIDSLHILIKPEVSKKITHLVTNLTGIEKEELDDGIPFTKAIRKLKIFFDKDSILLTWSTTDLLVLLENIRYFLKEQVIPFANYYADAQAFCQKCIDSNHTQQQMGLSRACELLNISNDDLSLHRAMDDSELTARVFCKVFDLELFEKYVYKIDENFYKRLFFKPKIISKVNNPLVKQEYLYFECPECKRELKPKGKWRYSCRMLCAEMNCRCGKKYTARVQIKELYDRVSVRRRLCEELPKETDENSTEKSE